MPSDASEFSASRSFILESIPSIAVMEAMPLQQFPLTCGKHEGSRPPFRHPQRYPPLADKLGNLFVMLQLQLVHNNMTRLGYSPAQCIKAVVSCGGPAARRFFAPGSIEGHGSLQADLARIIFSDSVSQLPCFKTFHPAAMVYKGYVALADTALAFKQAGLVMLGLQPSSALLPKLPELQLAVSRQPGSRPLQQVLTGSLGSASIYKNCYKSQGQQWVPAYIRLATAFVQDHLDPSRLPNRAQVVVDHALCPILWDIQAKFHTTQSSGANRSCKPQKQVRILGLQQLLPLLSLSSRRALVEVQDAHTLRVHFRTSQDLQDSFEGKEQLQKMTEQASRDLLVQHLASFESLHLPLKHLCILPTL